MTQILRRYATPLVTGLFLVSLVSGVLLFLHVGPRGVHGMHEILSMVLIVPFGLHLWRNWRSMTAYFGRVPMTVALAASALLAALFLIPSGGAADEGRRGPPQVALAAAVLDSPLAAVAPILDTTPDALAARLAADGYSGVGADRTLAAIADASGRDGQALLRTLLSGG